MLKKRNLIFLSLLILGVLLISGCGGVVVPSTYTVTFNSQGGSTVNTQTVEDGGIVTEPTLPTKEGYVFGGWYKESECTNAWDFANDTVTADVILFAKWTANPTYSLTMVVNPAGGGITIPAVGANSGYEANQVVNIIALPATNRNFIAWSGDVTGSVNPTTITMDANKTVTANFELVIGDSYEGGIVAYILQSGDPGYDVSVQHGLIAATADQSTGIQWYNGSNMTTGAIGTAIGFGQANTTAIVAAQGAGSYAAQLCDDLTIGGYTDWFLPSDEELDKLYINKVAIGGFADNYYWSSSESNASFAFLEHFGDGTHYVSNKSNSYRVRAVRDF